MDPLEYESLLGVCRVCLKAKRNNEEIRAEFRSWFKKYLSVDLDEEESCFPKKICKKCTATLQDFHNFYSTAETTTAILYSKLEKYAFEEISVAPIIKNECCVEKELPPVNKKLAEAKEDVLLINVKEDQNSSDTDMELDATAYLKEDEESMKEDNLPCDEVDDFESPKNNNQSDASSEGTHHCPQCTRKCKSKENLEIHMRLHEGLKPFPCPSCIKGFTRRTRLKEHLADAHGERMDFVCSHDGCGKIFGEKRSYKVHMQTKHPFKPADPLQDGNSANERKDINASNHGSSEEDDFVFISPRTKVHKGKHHCTQCPRRFQKEENLASHMRTHRGLKAFQCPHCDLAYAKKVYLKVHISDMHMGPPKEFVCGFKDCGKIFNRKYSFENHMRRAHPKNPADSVKAESRNFICEDCASSFKSLHELKRHRLSHLPKEERPFECKECGHRFMIERALTEHLLRHAGIKNFECSYCGMKKTTKRELRIHLNCHTKEKQWQCQLCPSIFNSSANLRRHDRVVHRAIRAFKCQYCELSFGKKETLTHHERRHTGEKPHQCEICERRFIQLVSLKTHLKTHSKHEDKKLAIKR